MACTVPFLVIIDATVLKQYLNIQQSNYFMLLVPLLQPIIQTLMPNLNYMENSIYSRILLILQAYKAFLAFCMNQIRVIILGY